MKRSPLKRSTGLKRASKKRQRENREYTMQRRAFLAQHHICQVCLLHAGRQMMAFATEIHHREGRGKNYLNEETWIPVCRTHHRWIHAHPRQARAMGFLK